MQLFSLSVLSDAACGADTPCFQQPEEPSLPSGWGVHSDTKPPWSCHHTHNHLPPSQAALRAGQCPHPVDIGWDICTSVSQHKTLVVILPIMKCYFQLLRPLSGINHGDWRFFISKLHGFIFYFLIFQPNWFISNNSLRDFFVYFFFFSEGRGKYWGIPLTFFPKISSPDYKL